MNKFNEPDLKPSIIVEDIRDIIEKSYNLLSNSRKTSSDKSCWKFYFSGDAHLPERRDIN